ncbi:hypothetical protein FHX81_1294 [Saccharothrix saharensis]|uniref:Uncharacterized protein n=1 Tax=Saccharothrix saharensis TaxID=571190 RepID=A0A543J863_9PSEU|nr:hypothetical protein [Saccharothrix saharensis]TQM79002.1 hypothetical protein FHX81_1294 [Saccharothrix saharensis]
MSDRVAEQLPYRGTAFYDDHAVRDFVGDPAGLSALEPGRGDGRYARELLPNHARVDGPPGAATRQVGGYSDGGPRNRRSLGAEVVKRHRTVERYVFVPSAAGSTLSGFSAGRPRQGDFDPHERHRAMRDVPFSPTVRGAAR